MSNSSKRVVVAMSGGVDSSVAPGRLKKAEKVGLVILMKTGMKQMVQFSKNCPVF